MIPENIKEIFKKNEDDFKKFSQEILDIIRLQIKAHANDYPSTFGSRKMIFTKEFNVTVFLVVEIFANGEITFFLGDTKKGDSPSEYTTVMFFKLQDEDSETRLEKFIKASKEHLRI